MRGSPSALNVEDRLEREGLPAATTAIARIGDPQEIEHAGDPDAAGVKVDGLRTAHQVPWASRARGVLNGGDALPLRHREAIPDPGEPLARSCSANSAGSPQTSTVPVPLSARGQP